MKRTLVILAITVFSAGLLAGCQCPPPEQPGPQPAADQCPPGVAGNAASSAYLPSGTQSNSAVLVEKNGPQQVIAGQEFRYNISVQNVTKMPLRNVQVIETLPENFDLVGASPKATRAGRDVKWELGTLAPGATQKLVVAGSANATGELQACTNVRYDNPLACLTMNAIRPAIAVSLTGPDQQMLCDPLTYQIVVRNTGTGTACNVQVKQNLPNGIETLDGRPTYMQNVGNLAAGQSKVLSFKARAKGKGSYSTTVMASADGGLTAESGPVATQVRSPSLVVTKQGPSMRYVGRPVTYEITVRNTGDAPAKNTMLEEQLRSGSQFVSADKGGKIEGRKVVWNLGTIDPGQSKAVKATLKSDHTGNINTVAVAEAYCAANAEAAGQTRIEGIPALLLETIDEEDPIEVGKDTVYRIRVTNQGSAEATNVSIVATLPAEEAFVKADGPTAGTPSGKTVQFAPLKNLAPKKQATWTVYTKGTATGDVRFRVKLTADQLTSPVEESESTHIYQ